MPTFRSPAAASAAASGTRSTSRRSRPRTATAPAASAAPAPPPLLRRGSRRGRCGSSRARARPRVGAAGRRLAEVLLLGLRRRALEPQPGRGRRRQRPARHVRLRSGHPAAVPAVRGLRGPVGADPRRRPASVRGAAARLMPRGRARTTAADRRPRLRERVAELERERELLNAIANYAPSLICLVDDDGRVRPYASNQAFERTLGYEPARDRRRVLLGAVRARRRAGRRARLHPLRDPAASRLASTKGAGCSATGRRVESRGRARRCRGSRAARCTSISGTDITDRKRHEAEVRQSRARIVAAADNARRRLERNLHDGAQQRLIALLCSCAARSAA